MNLIVDDDETAVRDVSPFRFFSGKNQEFFEFIGHFDDKTPLEKLVFNIARKPKHLFSHVQRVYYCFEKAWSEQLFAAITDLLIVLNGKGKAISKRLVFGAMSHLNEQEIFLLKELLAGKIKAAQLPGNPYSIFSRGLQGSDNLIQQADLATDSAYDPLALARDHIEYSQLEQAKRVLEQAISIYPLREELQLELLGLYRSTRDYKGFSDMFKQLQQACVGMVDGWIGLNNFFKGQNNNG